MKTGKGNDFAAGPFANQRKFHQMVKCLKSPGYAEGFGSVVCKEIKLR